MGSTCGAQFGQNGQKLHENYKIIVFGAKQWGGYGMATNFLGIGGRSLPRGNPANAFWKDLMLY